MSFKGVSIRGKVLMIVCAALLFQVLIGLTGMYYINRANRNLEAIVDREAEAIKAGSRVNSLFYKMLISEKNMIIAQSEDEVSGYRNSFDEDRRNLEKRLAALREVVGPAKAGDLDEFESFYREYLSTHQHIRELSEKNQDAEAMRISSGEGRDRRTKATAVLSRLVDDLDAALGQRKSESQTAAHTAMTLMIGIVVATLIIALGLALLVTRAITNRLGALVAAADAIAAGNLDTPIGVTSGDEVGRLASSMDVMQVALRAAGDEDRARDWLKTGLTRLNDVMRGELDVETLASRIISEISEYLDAKVGAFYVMSAPGEDATLSLLGSYAYTRRKNLSNLFKPGEGLVGQAALERKQILVSNVPEDYIKITSGLGEGAPRHICVTPLVFENRVKGVIEAGTLDPFTDLQLEYMNLAGPTVAITLETAQGRDQIANSLAEAQRLSEELQTQQEELMAANEELEEQTQRLQESEEKLKAQQEELQVINEELEEKNDLLERQKKEVEHARKDIEEKAEDLALASKYKSEFLANMSHELRTPLNSLLLLAQGLTQNREGNLTDEQVESARIIHGGGMDLLNLINDILDLSKIEAGRMDLQLGTVRMGDLAETVRTSFRHVAEEKGLDLEVVVEEDAPSEIVSDRRRLEQVVRNLLSNAIKFTESGSVTVTFRRSTPGVDLKGSGLPSGGWLAIAVRDTGIGISPGQQKIVFEAFQQADGGTARKYGGTGLGLSISRELAHLLSGTIELESEPGKGSTFTLYLPISASAGRGGSAGDRGTIPGQDKGEVSDATRKRSAAIQIDDDRDSLENDDRVILIIEDDPNFARLLCGKCHEKGFMCLAASTGEMGLELAAKYLPSAVILDIRLPGMDGWAVLTAFKENTRIRHIPVHIVSVEEASNEALRKGAVGHATKPLDQKTLEETFRRLERASAEKPRRVLVVEDDAKIRRDTVQLIDNGDVKVEEAENGEQALQALRSGRYDCVVLDLGLPDMSGDDLLARLESEGVEVPPVIIHTARDLTMEEEMALREHAESIVIKDVRSRERLLDEVSLFLHQVVSKMPEKKKQMILSLHETDVFLKNKEVLIVDDDMRTTFALSRLLAGRGMKTLKADTGERALRILDEEPNVDLVLMDIMMPVMDGYEAMGRIRAQERFRKLPIIALTAKAMQEDREKCIASGASDYLPKPVDENRLISMMRVWLYK